MGEPILDPGRQAGMCVHDGSEWRKAKGDADGHAQVDVLSSALPVGAATETTLSAINTELAEKLETADLALDTQKHLDTHDVPHTSKITTHFAWDVTVPAGGTYTLLSTTSGHGKVLYFLVRVDGVAAEARWSHISFLVDGETSPSTRICIEHIYLFICGGRVVDLNFGGTYVWDTVNYLYGVWAQLGPAFESSLKVIFENGDSANEVKIRACVWVEWLK